MRALLRTLFRGAAGIDVADAARRVEAGEILLVDVRERSEWRAGRAPRATHVPLARVPREADALARHGKPVAFICRSGHRSAAACATARSHGVEALNVHGGMTAWRRAGLPVATG